MTREEASEIIKNIDHAYRSFSAHEIEALEIAIKALEQEPCEDCISRKAVINTLGEWIVSGEYQYTNATEYLVKKVKDLPPVQSKQNRCNQCKYYDGVHNVQGHAPCSFLKCGGVLWDWYCSNYEPQESEE